MFEKNKNSLQKGSCVLDIDQLFPTVEKGENFPSVVLLGNLGPVTEPEISFTVLDLKSQDVHLELRYKAKIQYIGQTWALGLCVCSYTLKT